MDFLNIDIANQIKEIGDKLRVLIFLGEDVLPDDLIIQYNELVRRKNEIDASEKVNLLEAGLKHGNRNMNIH